jgi:hypothetical protein
MTKPVTNHKHLAWLILLGISARSPALPVPQTGPKLAAYVAWCQEALRKVERGDEPPSRADVFSIQAARNEYEPFQLVVRASGDLPADMPLVFTDLEGIGGHRITADYITIRRGRFVPFVEPADPAKKYQRIRYQPSGAPADAAKLEDGTADEVRAQRQRTALPGAQPERARNAPPPFSHSKQGVANGWLKRETLDLIQNESGFVYDPAGRRKCGTLGEVLSRDEQNRVYWITVYVPSDVPAAEYRGSIILGSGAERHELRYKLGVWDFTLPRKMSFNLSMGVPRNGPAYSRLFTDKDFFEHRVSLRELGADLKLSFSEADEPIINWTDFDRRAAHIIEELGMTGFQVPHAYVVGGHGDVARNRRPGLKEGEYAGMLSFGGYLGVPYCPDDPQFAKYYNASRGGPDGMDETFRNRFRNYLSAFARHTKMKGWFNDFGLSLFDEPLPRSYGQLRSLARLAKQADVDYKPTAPGASPNPGLVGYFQKWSGYFRPNQRDFNVELLRERQDFGEPFRSGNPWNDWMINRTPLYVRGYLWWAWVERIDGAGSWTIADWQWVDPNPDAINTNEQFWSYMVYPPEKGEDRYHASVRWEMTREGQEDYEYFRILQELLAADFARREKSMPVRGARDEVTRMIEKIIKPGWVRIDEPDLMYRVRAEAAARIVELQRGMK